MIIKKKKNTLSENTTKSEINVSEEPKEELINLDSVLNMTEREERRRGDRRRGYRRIEDRNLVSRAHEEAQLIKEQATQDGFKNGMLKAEKEIKDLQNAINSILDVKKQAYNYYQKDVTEIAIKVAEKILNAQVEVQPDTIIAIVENVIKEISTDENKITFIINPADELIVKENLENNSVFQNKKATMSVQTDERIEKGSCKVITKSGQIDATFTSQLDIINKAFKEGM